MNTPERSAAIAQALASEAEGLPIDFAKQVAALAETRAIARSSIWTAVAMAGAFIAMLGVCVLGWLSFGDPENRAAAWLDPFMQAVTPQPWLVIGIAGFLIVQLLTFRRRALA